MLRGCVGGLGYAKTGKRGSGQNVPIPVTYEPLCVLKTCSLHLRVCYVIVIPMIVSDVFNQPVQYLHPSQIES